MEVFTGHDQQNVAIWIDHINVHLAELNIPVVMHLPFALIHLSPDVRACVLSLTDRLERETGRNWEWTWAKVQVALTEIENQINQGGSRMNIEFLKIFGTGKAAHDDGPEDLVDGLRLFGFSETGPVAKSGAARAQSAFYGGNVGSGSIFSKCQSLSMGNNETEEMVASAMGIGGIVWGTIKEIRSKIPSRQWEDGKHFRPSKEVIEALSNLVERDVAAVLITQAFEVLSLFL